MGENDSYIYSLIRQGLTEEFISYTNRATISLLSIIQPSIFETNLFLMQKTPTLIEYASFFGSIEIIQNLQYKNISLTNSMWLYEVHSDNAELIHFLEENKIKPLDNNQNNFNYDPFNSNYNYNLFNFNYNYNPFMAYQKERSITYKEIYEESIKSHHNAIADYIKENYLVQIQVDCYEQPLFPI
ncbi:hypothetical protein M9Y10_008519 [Tritrichomonas musculus]|uniref:DUF3447 domain-containing protein n=1 Tax=Tritrichomonas musculus TaxID=1915356 RepID=A0ABR2IZ40_9EUKA